MVDMREVFRRSAVDDADRASVSQRRVQGSIPFGRKTFGRSQWRFHQGPAGMEVVHASTQNDLVSTTSRRQVHRKQLEEKCQAFARGDWVPLSKVQQTLAYGGGDSGVQQGLWSNREKFLRQARLWKESPVPEDILNARPDHPFLCEQFLLNLRSSKR